MENMMDEERRKMNVSEEVKNEEERMSEGM